MKRLFLFIFPALFSLSLAEAPVFAGSTHYTNGIEGIKAATLPPPGVYYRLYNVFYNAGEMRTVTGRKAPMDFDVSVYAMANRFIYSSDIELLGGNLIMDLIVPLVYTDISAHAGGNTLFGDNKFGLGDICVEPFVLGWHGPQWDAAFGVGLFMPTGSYDDDRPASPGKGYWTPMFSLGGTYYFDQAKTWSASLLARYEIHSEQEDTDITYGNDFHFEWGVGKTIFQYFDVGLAGYCSWKVTDNSGRDAPSSTEEAYAVGPEIAAFFPQWGFGVSLRSLWEFENRNGSQGNITTLTLTKGF